MRRDRSVSSPPYNAAPRPHAARREKRVLKRPHLLRNLLAFIGAAFVLVELARYVAVPLLVWLGSLSGGGV